jgi:hypothetical protein
MSLGRLLSSAVDVQSAKEPSGASLLAVCGATVAGPVMSRGPSSNIDRAVVGLSLVEECMAVSSRRALRTRSLLHSQV